MKNIYDTAVSQCSEYNKLNENLSKDDNLSQDNINQIKFQINSEAVAKLSKF